MKVPLLPDARAGITGHMPLSAIWYRFFADLVEYLRPLAGVVEFDSSTQEAVAFTTDQRDDEYMVAIEPSENNTFWISNKTVGGFTLNAASSSSAAVRWTIRR